MRLFPEPPINRAKWRGQRAQGEIRTLLIGAVCLVIGFGLGGWWHFRRTQQRGSIPAAETGAPESQAPRVPAAAPPQPAAAAIDPAIVAEVKRQIPNVASVSLEAGAQILRGNAIKDLQTALSQTSSRIKELEQRLARLEAAKSETDRQAAVQELQRLQAEQTAKLSEYTIRSSAQIEALRQLKESASGSR